MLDIFKYSKYINHVFNKHIFKKFSEFKNTYVR